MLDQLRHEQPLLRLRPLKPTLRNNTRRIELIHKCLLILIMQLQLLIRILHQLILMNPKYLIIGLLRNHSERIELPRIPL